MFSIAHLNEKVTAYAAGEISLGQFEDWFYEATVDPVDFELEEVVGDIDSALSAWHFGNHSQADLRRNLQELAKAVRPFVLHEAPVEIRYERSVGAFAAVAYAVVLAIPAPNAAVVHAALAASTSATPAIDSPSVNTASAIRQVQQEVAVA